MDLLRLIVTRLVIVVVVVIEEKYSRRRPSKQHRGMVDESKHSDEPTSNVNLLRIILGIVAALPVPQPRNRNPNILYIFILVSTMALGGLRCVSQSLSIRTECVLRTGSGEAAQIVEVSAAYYKTLACYVFFVADHSYFSPWNSTYTDCRFNYLFYSLWPKILIN